MDYDGLPDDFEYFLGTDPYSPDTDYDGVGDGYEWLVHFPPRDDRT